MDTTSTRIASQGRITEVANEWFLGSEAPAPLPTLVVFPHAGAGAAAYWRLAQSQSDLARTLIVRLPGRESRAGEQRFTDIRPLIRALAPALRPRLGDNFVFYGHSMGALIAFETARLFSLAYAMPPRHLVVSGMEAPQDTSTVHARHLLGDAELWQLVGDMGGVPPEIVSDMSMRQMLLPTIRADFQVTDTYSFRAMPLLTCPISAYAGESDPELPPSAMAGWGANTTGTFEHTILPGDHFFNLGGKSGFTEVLRALLTE
ncbi:alpha/beta fold hydrolase [Streptomyces sp. ICN988]|uniref:thioesterase II family protein n=1 Tax=Streptomyces sp. ICN988 TaxID=2983765 RepID=UPI0021E46080|nr:alpha/beta fold hydrolase [Streptomyces sp. ICN988]MCV2458216.1 alpha/beta fold hydrolase [Streptomyces sp. ICN988]